MRFRPGAKLDPGQVTDVRGRRLGGGGLALGGGGLGVIGVVIYLLFTLLSGGGLGQLAPLDDTQSARGHAASSAGLQYRRGRERAGGLPHRRRRQQRAELLGGVFTRAAGSTPRRHRLLHRDRADRLRLRELAGRPVLLSGDQLVYIDLGFFDELSRSSARAATPFARRT